MSWSRALDFFLSLRFPKVSGGTGRSASTGLLFISIGGALFPGVAQPSGYVAQLVEHRAFNLMDVGSSPAIPNNGSPEQPAIKNQKTVELSAHGEMAEWLKALVC